MNQNRLDDFAFDLNACMSPSGHLWVKSGRCTVSPLERSVAGVKGFHAPPFAAKDMELRFAFTADGHAIADNGDAYAGTTGLPFAGGIWRPDRIIRRGTFHRLIDGRLLSLGVESHLIPLASRAGFMVALKIRNRSGRRVRLEIEPRLQPGCPNAVPLTSYQWNWPPPGEPAEPSGIGQWRNAVVQVQLVSDAPEPVYLEHDTEIVCRFAILLDRTGEAEGVRPDLAELDREAELDWLRRLEWVDAHMPTFHSNIPELDAYWRGSLMSGLVSLWDHPDFVVRPFPATLGVEGAGLVCYLWDLGGYVPHVMSMLLVENVRRLIKAFLAVDIARHYALTPGGTGSGVGYSFSGYALVNLYYRHVCQNQMDLDLFPEVAQAFLSADSCYARSGALLDYGTQDNLLETSTTGYEHIVPSPNAERAWCYDRLADLADLTGRTGAAAWRDTARIIREEIRQRLWDEERGWFLCLHPGGRSESVYSVQCFNLLDLGVCTKEMSVRMLSHLRPGAFLGRFGVSSMSREDEIHYEVNDPDWSGAGAYVGTPPLLAKILWCQGRQEPAWDVLRRVLWLGQSYPYYPQEHFCDRPMAPHWKRANEIAGFAGCEAILSGMLGFAPQLDGSLWVNPQIPVGGHVEICGFPFAGHRVDVRASSEECEVRVDGTVVFSGRPEGAFCVVK
ncbi:MAG: hypothetical protein WAX69_12205 [Victivallales bacterium]